MQGTAQETKSGRDRQQAVPKATHFIEKGEERNIISDNAEFVKNSNNNTFTISKPDNKNIIPTAINYNVNDEDDNNNYTRKRIEKVENEENKSEDNKQEEENELNDHENEQEHEEKQIFGICQVGLHFLYSFLPCLCNIPVISDVIYDRNRIHRSEGCGNNRFPLPEEFI